MEIPWGKLILGGLAGIATWKSFSPDQQQKVLSFVELSVLTLGQVGIALAEQQQLALLASQELKPAPDPTPLPPPPDWLDDALRQSFADYQPLSESVTREEPHTLQVDPDGKWREVIVPPAVVLVLGKRGSGKSALAYRLLELFRYQLSCYVVGAPAKARQLLPDWIGIVPALEDLPNKSIAVVDEAYLAYHARESMSQESKAMSQMLNLSRQREQTLIFVAQEARQVDKNIASTASVLAFKELGMLQPEFERPELRKLMAAAGEGLRGTSGDKRKWAYVYSPDADFVGLLASELASFWKPSLSRLFAAEGTPAKSRTAERITPKEKAQIARGLRDQGLSYSQISHRLGVSKSTVANYLKGYPYRSQ